jgi:hypothetical protein
MTISIEGKLPYFYFRKFERNSMPKMFALFSFENEQFAGGLPVAGA